MFFEWSLNSVDFSLIELVLNLSYYVMEIH